MAKRLERHGLLLKLYMLGCDAFRVFVSDAEDTLLALRPLGEKAR